jgi:hypothetical protein
MANEIESTEVINARVQAQLAAQAKAAQSLRTSGAFITFKNANLKIDGQSVPNNQATVRVLAAIPERAWYDGPYDADNAQVPACYALDSMSPHPEASNPQVDTEAGQTCKDCAKNKWGTAPPRPGSNVPGKGKACREGARVIVAPATADLASAALYTAKVPVTSLSAIQNYIGRCASSGHMSGEFIGILSVTEDKKSFFKVHLEIKEHTADLDRLTLLKKQEDAMELALQPYPQLD